MGVCFNIQKRKERNSGKVPKGKLNIFINSSNIKDNKNSSSSMDLIRLNNSSPILSYCFYSKINSDPSLLLIWSNSPQINKHICYWDSLNLFSYSSTKSRSILGSLIAGNEVYLHLHLSLQSRLKYERQHIAEQLGKGPPNNIRWAIWSALAKFAFSSGTNNNNINNSHNFPSSTYEELLNTNLLPKVGEQINKDLNRTAPNYLLFQSESGRVSLFNLLKAFAAYDQPLGYCQGINLIVANLLLLSDGEEKSTFDLVKFFFSHLNLRDFFTKGFPGVALFLYVSKTLIKIFLPRVDLKVTELNLTDEVWLFKWIQSLYALVVDVEIFVRLWDCLVAYGLDFLFAFTLGFLKVHEEEINAAQDMFDFVEIFKKSGGGTVTVIKKLNFFLINEEGNIKTMNIISNKGGPIHDTKNPADNHLNSPNDEINHASPSISEDVLNKHKFREKVIKYSMKFKSEIENSGLIPKLKEEYNAHLKEGRIENVYYDEGSFYSAQEDRSNSSSNKVKCPTGDRLSKFNLDNKPRREGNFIPEKSRENSEKSDEHNSQENKTLENSNIIDSQKEFKLDATANEDIVDFISDFSYSVNKENTVHNLSDTTTKKVNLK